MQLENLLKEKFNKLNLSLESSTYHEKSKALDLCFSYSDDCLLNDDLIGQIKKAILDFLKVDVGVNLKFKKRYLDSTILGEYLAQFLKTEYPVIIFDPSTLIFENGKVHIELDKVFEEFATKNDLRNEIEKSISEHFTRKISVEIEYKKLLADEPVDDEPIQIVNDVPLDEINLNMQEAFIGEIIEVKPTVIARHKEVEEGVCICGKLKGLTQFKTKPKIDENGKEKPERVYYKFKVVDFSGEMNVVYFPSKLHLPKIESLEEGTELVLFGSIEDDKFGAGVVFRPKIINLCILPQNFFERRYVKPVPKNYRLIKPEPYQENNQINLFSASDVPIKNEFLLNNTFVVFDLETTGVEYNKSKIIEIGAVKLIKGKIVETFSCLIDPQIHIPADATKVNNITDQDVAGKPTIDEVMPDFYKFCDDTIMVSYVIDFDFKFIDYNAKQCGYEFTNETFDAFVLAKQKLKGLKNYKLKTVTATLGVSLENAHRAVFDTIATAEAMIKLLENY